MSNIAVIYWSQTGNTELMASAIVEGIREAGGSCDLFSVPGITADQAAEYEKVALGCPAMGAEVLEEIDFEPFFTELERRLAGRSVALFGSYGWGDGQWMRDWVQRTQDAGANVFQDQGLMIQETPDEEGLEQCQAFGREFAQD